MFSRLKHAKNKIDKQVEPDYNPQFALPGSNELVAFKEESWGAIFLRWGKSVLLYILLLVAVCATLYSGLAATVLIVTNIDGEENKTTLVLRNMWQETGGKPPVGEEAIISTTDDAPSSFLNWVLTGWTGINNQATVEIKSGNMDKLYMHGDQLYYDEDWVHLSPTEAFNPPEQSEGAQTVQLDDQILVQCVSGACEAGEMFIITSSQIFGERKDL